LDLGKMVIVKNQLTNTMIEGNCTSKINEKIGKLQTFNHICMKQELIFLSGLSKR
jgi:hypothetical protein